MAGIKTLSVWVAGLLIACSATTGWSADWLINYEQALKESRQTGKPILANFTGSDWCGWCIKLKQEVFVTSQFGAWADDSVILLELDYPRRKAVPAPIQEQNAKLKQKYGITGYPTILFLDHEGNILGRSGYKAGGPGTWTTSVQPIVDRMPEIELKEIEVVTDLVAGISASEESGKPMLLVVEPGDDANTSSRLDTLLTDMDVADLLADDAVVVRLRRAGEEATPIQQVMFATKMLGDLGVGASSTQVALLNPTDAGMELLYSTSAVMAPRFFVAQLEKKMPTPPYTGGWIEDFEQARGVARAEGRSILLDFTGSDWCGWCVKLDREVFETEAFKAYADENLVLVKLDFPRELPQSPEVKQQNQALMQKYGVRGFPTIVMLNASGREIGRTGYREGGGEPYVAHLKKMVGSGG